MSLSTDQKHLRRLLSKLVDGELGDGGYETLRDRLADDPDARAAAIEFWAMHAALEARGEEPLAEEAPIVASASRPARARERFTGWVGLLAASVAVACGSWWMGASLTGDEADIDAGRFVGLLTRTSNAVWQGDEPPVPGRLTPGQELNLADGLAEVTLNAGVVVTVRGPALLELVSDMQVRAHRGAVRARVGPEAKGFTIQTPTAGVVDLGTEFGVAVDDGGETDVVVFDGLVNLTKPEGSSRRTDQRFEGQAKTLAMGEALRVDSSGELTRIMSVDSQRFPPSSTPERRSGRGPIIRSVSDNLRASESSMHYEIVAGGFGEDVRAYVDRFHEWNGVDDEGIPHELLGGDYVMTFNSDKWSETIALDVELARPANLYVLLDRRVPTPNWLAAEFSDTGLSVGVDEGWWSPNGQRFGLDASGRLRPLGRARWGAGVGEPPSLPSGLQPLPEHRCSRGPGLSIDKRYSVWGRQVQTPQTITLHGLGVHENRFSMYGIVASPLRDE